jgi:hypothetical protein
VATTGSSGPTPLAVLMPELRLPAQEIKLLLCWPSLAHPGVEAPGRSGLSRVFAPGGRASSLWPLVVADPTFGA